jgi:tRNA A-37 threonylcarbamoyl transferase component Bud32
MSEDLHPADIPTHAGTSVAGGTAPARPRRPGDVVAGKYVLTRYLARGGMAEVWLGTHESLKTDVAIKFVDVKLARDKAAGPYVLERFRFEAQLSARLGARTRQVVAVHDAGEHEGAPYLVMEYVPGRTLDAEVEANGPLSPARFAEVLDQIANALGAAHELGVIHRDLKPSNLLLVDEPDGKLSVKLADFGVAKAFGTTLALDRPRETQEGEMVGSPAFMSPEQARGIGQIDARSDIWSLGVVAYETLTGKPCFDGLTLLDVFASITMARYEPPRTARPDLPDGIDAWMARALAIDPADRFESVEEMASEFRVLLGGRRRAAQRRRRIVVAILVAAALMLLAVAIARVASGPKPPAPVASSTTMPSAAAPVTPAPVSTGAVTSAPPHAPEPPVASTGTERSAVRPPVTAAPSVTLVMPPTAVAPPPPPPPPPATAAPEPPRRPNKGINPSEIQ